MLDNGTVRPCSSLQASWRAALSREQISIIGASGPATIHRTPGSLTSHAIVPARYFAQALEPSAHVSGRTAPPSKLCRTCFGRSRRVNAAGLGRCRRRVHRRERWRTRRAPSNAVKAEAVRSNRSHLRAIGKRERRRQRGVHSREWRGTGGQAATAAAPWIDGQRRVGSPAAGRRHVTLAPLAKLRF